MLFEVSLNLLAVSCKSMYFTPISTSLSPTRQRIQYLASGSIQQQAIKHSTAAMLPDHLGESFDADLVLLNCGSVCILLPQPHFLSPQLCQHSGKTDKDYSVAHAVREFLLRKGQREGIVVNYPDQSHIDHLCVASLSEDNILEPRFVDGTKLKIDEFVIRCFIVQQCLHVIDLFKSGDDV
jgi:hypothetical protein